MKLHRNHLLILLALISVISLFFAGCGDDDDDDSSTFVPEDDDDTTDDDDQAVDDDDDDNDDDNDDNDDNDDDDTYPEYPNDDLIRVNHIQMLGTHNSYHIERDGISHPEHHYTREPLDEQLDMGVRQFELDVHWVPWRGLLVYHIPIIDQVTTCETLVECLTVMKDWSDDNPGHHPLLVLLEPKDDLHLNDIHLHTEDFETNILKVWPRDRILTPDDVRGDYATLKQAILTEGWPTLGQARDKIILHGHSGGAFRDEYLADYPNLEGSLMFVDSSVNDDFGGIVIKNDPIGSFDEIQAAVEDGFLVRTRADSCCDEAEANDHTRHFAALDSGANAVSTDFPALIEEFDYVVEIPDGNPSRCNPISAPDFCTPEDIENLPD